MSPSTVAKQQSYKEFIESIPFCAEAILAGLCFKTAQVMQKTSENVCTEIGLGKNFAQTEKEPEMVVKGICSRADQTLQSSNRHSTVPKISLDQAILLYLFIHRA